jgi:hypothetical protein
MLTIGDVQGKFGRRDFLRIGSLTLGGLSLPGLLAARAAAAPGGGLSGPLATDKSVIFLFLHGGPSQIETFDPKLTAPQDIRSTTGEVPTKLPGITFGGTFPKLASLADKLTVVRSFTTGDANHDIKPIVGRDTLGANLGSIYSRVVGPNQAVSGMPTNVALFPRAVDSARQKETSNFGRFTSAGSLGEAYAPFVPGAGGDMQKDMQLSLPMSRLDDRRVLLSNLDRVKATIESDGARGLDALREQAFSTIVGGVSDAFDLSKEDPKTVARYDTAPLVQPSQISRRWNNYNNYVDNAKTVGKLLLLARRLCERGCGFVTVTTNFVWDMHADVNNAGCSEGMDYMGVPLDHAVSAFVADLKERGLTEKILLVCCGEMGRTPRINKAGGRDHWGNLAPLLLHGGGLTMGQVIGQSTRNAGEPQTEPITNKHLISTVLHTLLDVGKLRVTRGVPNNLLRLAEHDVIPGVM